MDIPTHMAFFTGGMLDPVVWMRMVRVIFFIASAFLMLKEPMLCGGRNTFFHRLLSLQLFVAAFYSYGIAKARMAILVVDPASLVNADLLMFEIAYTVSTGALMTKLLYDLIKYQSMQKVKIQPRTCNDCPRVFIP